MINKKDLSGVAVQSRSEINQINYATSQGIKQVFLVSAEELQGLVNTLNRNIDSLKDGCIDNTIWSLITLKNNIENHLGGIK